MICWLELEAGDHLTCSNGLQVEDDLIGSMEEGDELGGEDELTGWTWERDEHDFTWFTGDEHEDQLVD